MEVSWLQGQSVGNTGNNTKSKFRELACGRRARGRIYETSFEYRIFVGVTHLPQQILAGLEPVTGKHC